MISSEKTAQPILYIFFGLIASGKSTLAELFAEQRFFSYYNTDRLRKELAGLAANERRADEMDQGIYTPAFTEKTYQTMLDRAARDFQHDAAGVVLDGSYSKATDRHKVREQAAFLGVQPLFFFCACSEQEARRRLALRDQDPNAVSDGRWDIFVQQREKFEQPDELPPQQLSYIDTEAEPEELLRQLKS